VFHITAKLNSIPHIAELAAKIYKNGLARGIMIVGGIGHSTKYLIQNVLQDNKYKDIDANNKSEAEIFEQIISRGENIEQEKILIISYSPFIPHLKILEGGYEYVNGEINGLWTKDRFIDLLMVEIPRLRDDGNGYGPKGKEFIVHVDIPEEVLDSYQRLLTYYTEYNEIKNRK